MFLKPEPGTILLNANSSMVSGLAAALFDIILLGIIKAQAQWLCSIANLYLVYDKRRSVAPTSSRLGLLWESPVGHIKLVRFLSLLIALSTICIFIMGFSITGKTVSQYKHTTFRSLVQISDTPAEINYKEEFREVFDSDNATLVEVEVSRRLAAMSYSYNCILNNYTHFNIYAYAYENIALDKGMVNIKNPIQDAECVTKEHFLEDLLVRSHRVHDIRTRVECKFDNLQPRVASGERKLVSVDVTTKSCGMKISRLQCYGDERMSCVAVGYGNGDNEDILFALMIPDYKHPDDWYARPVSNGELLKDTTKHEDFAANMAFLHRAGVGGSINHLGLIALSSVKHDVELSRRMREVQATEIALYIALPVVCLVAVIMLVLGVTVTLLWVRVVYMKGRGQYNAFAAVPDALEIVDMERASKLRQRLGKQRWVGIREDSPVISEGQRQDVSGASWVEDEIR